MSTGPQLEATVDVVIAKMKALLPAKMAEINGTISDEFELTMPNEVTFGQRSEMTFPWLAILPNRTRKVTDASGMMIYKHTIWCVSWVECWQEDGIGRLITRQMQAVREVGLAKRQPGQAFEEGGGGYGLEYIEDLPGPVFSEPGKDGVTTWGRTVFDVRQEQYI